MSTRPAGRRLRAVVFDLDDTLVPQAPWLAGAWDAVAATGADRGADRDALRRALAEEAAAGSARGGIIDRALARVAPTIDAAPLVDTFRSHRPAHLDPYPGAAAAVAACRRAAVVGLISDGDPDIQRAKLDASGLAGAFDAVVLSDELGREHRKPDPLPFVTVLRALGVEASATAFVGDRPTTDLAGAGALGFLTVRVRTGEYADCEGDRTADVDAATVVEAVEALLPLLAGGSDGVSGGERAGRDGPAVGGPV